MTEGMKFLRCEVASPGSNADLIAMHGWQAVMKSFHKDRSGDVLVLQEPYSLFLDPLTSERSKAYTTTHGTPYWYDTHVPLLVYGPGVAPAVRRERVTPLQVAPILARALGVEMPAGTEAQTPAGLFK